ncbi:myo-inositol-1-monophosphatase [Bisporella sp. PMI_857]|nr:myo-inositol-1-monophosphatase [Bisporella sp. PMI_857]
MAEIDLKEIHDLLVRVAREAGCMQLSAKPSRLENGTKKNSADLVTETDQAVENMVFTRLTAAYPDYAFIGEETYQPGMTLSDRPTFIVDPIDGTTNFVHNFPAYCISLGFVANRIPIIGIIYNPYLDELYSAVKGKGAFLHRHKGETVLRLPLKHPEPLRDLSTCLVGAEWGSDRAGSNFRLKTEVFAKLAAAKEDGGAMVHSIRCVGSAALNLALVATGQQDVFWDGGCWAWDVAAGWCILTEAGGVMASGNPGDWEPTIDGRKYLAIRAAPEGQREIIEEFWSVIGKGRMDYKS